MFLKNVKKINLNSIPIKFTLTFLYTLTTAVFLIFIGFFSSYKINQILETKNYLLAIDRIRIISSILSSEKGGHDKLKREVEDIDINHFKESIDQYYLRVIDIEDKNIIETKNIQSFFKGVPFFTGIPSPIDVTMNWVSKEDHANYFFMQKVLYINKKNFVVQIGINVTFENKWLSEYRQGLILILVILIFTMIFLGFMIAKKGLQNIHHLTETTKIISSNSLYKRIFPQDWSIELRELALAFNQMLDRIESAFSRLQSFSSDIAHELRTPVNNLLGEIDIALSHAPSQNEYQLVLESNREEVMRISQIIESLIFLAQTENPKFFVQKSILDIKHEISIVTNYYQSMADDSNIQIHCSGEGKLYGNSVIFQRMISNILLNALKYAYQNTNIYINIIHPDQNHLKISIQDEGPGIAEEHLPKIFDRFYRTDFSRSHDTGGMGLGLAIAKSIAELHNGTISVSSSPSKGAKFEILLPKVMN